MSDLRPGVHRDFGVPPRFVPDHARPSGSRGAPSPESVEPAAASRVRGPIGRPVTGTAVRSCNVSFLIDEGAYRLLKATAEAAGQTVSTYLYRLLCRQLQADRAAVAQAKAAGK